MPVTSNEIANQAIQLIGANQTPVLGVAPSFDKSAAGITLQKLYAPCVATVMRQFGWDASRRTVALVLSGNPAPYTGWVEYLYPTNGIQVWQIRPAVPDLNNPVPYNFLVANALVVGVEKKVIQANLAGAVAVYNNNPTEDNWDALLRETVVRLLASELAIALAGKPQTSELNLKAGGAFEQIGEARQD